MGDSYEFLDNEGEVILSLNEENLAVLLGVPQVGDLLGQYPSVFVSFSPDGLTWGSGIMAIEGELALVWVGSDHVMLSTLTESESTLWVGSPLDE